MKPIFVAVVALLAGVGRVMAADMPVPQLRQSRRSSIFPLTTIGAAFISASTAATVLVKATGLMRACRPATLIPTASLLAVRSAPIIRRARIWSGSRATSIGLVSKVAVPPPPALPSEPLPAQPAKPRVPGWALRAHGWVMHSIVCSFSAPAAPRSAASRRF